MYLLCVFFLNLKRVSVNCTILTTLYNNNCVSMLYMYIKILIVVHTVKLTIDTLKTCMVYDIREESSAISNIVMEGKHIVDSIITIFYSSNQPNYCKISLIQIVSIWNSAINTFITLKIRH